MPSRETRSAILPKHPGRPPSRQPVSIFVSAGEASGDWAGARLARAIIARDPEVSVHGIGGRQMLQAGVQLMADSSEWSAIGLIHSLGKVPRIWRALRAAQRRLAAEPQMGVVLIDFGAFNVPLARAARRAGCPTLYYMPPGSWSRKPRKRDLQALVDVVAAPFPWSKEVMSGGRARIEWVGHPVVESARPRMSPEAARARYGIDADRPVLALAPGSRTQEVRYVLPVMARAAALLARRVEGIQFLVPVAPSLSREVVGGGLEAAGVNAVLLEGMEYDALQLAQAAAVCSGTATLELACLQLPMVVVYRAGLAATLEYALLRGRLGGQRFAALPNIIADREIVRELLGAAATPTAIAAAAGELLCDGQRRARMRSDLAAVASALGPPGASERTAELVLGLMGRLEEMSEPDPGE